MALALTVLNAPSGTDNSQTRTKLYGTAAFSGSYTAGGESVAWGSLNDVSGQVTLVNTLGTPAPVWVEFQLSQPASGSPAYTFRVEYNYTTGKFQVYGSPATSAEGTGFEELAAGSYPANVSGAKWRWAAEFVAE